MDSGIPGVVIGLSIIAVEVFVATFTIIFIMSIMLRDFYRKKELDSRKKIQLALKVSTIMFTTALTYNVFSTILQPDLYKMSHQSPLFTVVIVYCMCSCTWLIAVLCFLNLIKIVHFQWVFITWAKKRINSIVSWQIAVGEVVSLSISLLHLLLYRATHVSSTNSSCISSTDMTIEENTTYDYVTYLLLIVIGTSFVLSIITVLVTTAFLRCHINEMKDTNTTGEVHQYNRAIQAMLRLLFLYSVFYVMMFLYYFSVFALYSVGYWIDLISIFSFIPAVNVLQIFGTPHLWTTWKEMTSLLLCREPNTY